MKLDQDDRRAIEIGAFQCTHLLPKRGAPPARSAQSVAAEIVARAEAGEPAFGDRRIPQKPNVTAVQILAAAKKAACQ